MLSKLFVSFSFLVLPMVNAEAAEHYFYSFPQTEEDSGEWVYKVTECLKLSVKEYASLKAECEKEGAIESCNSKKTLPAEHSITGEKKQFATRLVIFSTKSKCVDARTAFLNKN